MRFEIAFVDNCQIRNCFHTIRYILLILSAWIFCGGSVSTCCQKLLQMLIYELVQLTSASIYLLLTPFFCFFSMCIHWCWQKIAMSPFLAWILWWLTSCLCCRPCAIVSSVQLRNFIAHIFYKEEHTTNGYGFSIKIHFNLVTV